MKYVSILILLSFTACSETDLQYFLESEAISRVEANNLWIGEYSGNVVKFDSISPCPNNNATVTFSFVQERNTTFMRFERMGPIGSLELVVSTFNNTGTRISVEASGNSSNNNINFSGHLSFREFSALGTELLKVSGDITARSPGGSTCYFEVALDSKEFNPESL